MEKKTMITIEVENEEKETFKDKLAKHKKGILTGVGMVTLGVGAYFGYKGFKYVQFLNKVNKEQNDVLKMLATDNMSLKAIAYEASDNIDVITKIISDGELIPQSRERTERQLTYLTSKLEKLLESSEKFPNDEDIKKAIDIVKGKISHLRFVKNKTFELETMMDYFDE